jgi:hypothetical protein
MPRTPMHARVDVFARRQADRVVAPDDPRAVSLCRTDQPRPGASSPESQSPDGPKARLASRRSRNSALLERAAGAS